MIWKEKIFQYNEIMFNDDFEIINVNIFFK